MDNKQKHLEFTQGVINRMVQNSFLIKGWSITLVSALFALAAKDSNQKFIVIAFFPTIIFWLLDSYYLYQEQVFRDLYDDIRQKKEEDIDFSLDTKKFDNGFLDWAKAAFSKTIGLFYTIIFLTLIIVSYVLK